MEAARERGHARSIGVSNFSVGELEQVIGVANDAPVVNQVQFSPFEYRRELLEACTSHGRGGRGLQPAGHRPALDRQDGRRGGERLGRTPAQVLIRWCLQREQYVLPKSTHQERIDENSRSRLRSCPRRIWPPSTRWTRARHRSGPRAEVVVRPVSRCG